MKLMISLGILFLLSNLAIASDDFKGILRQELIQASSAASTAPEATQDVEFKQFWLGFQPTVIFGVNSILNVQVTPEITLEWERP